MKKLTKLAAYHCRKTTMINFNKPIVYAHDCFCPMCDEPVCPNCYEHYADCDCPGPHSEISDSENDEAEIHSVQVEEDK